MTESVNAVREALGDYAVAAIIAGVVSLMTTTVTVRATRKTNALSAEDARRLAEMKAGWEAFQEQLNHYVLPAQSRVREHLAKTRDLLGRVLTSFSRLVKLAATRLSPDQMLTEVTNTLDVYAEYRRHITKPEEISYPEELKQRLKLAHTQLAKIMLDLHAEPASNGSNNTMLADKLREFEALKNAASLIIEKQLTVSLELPNPVARADVAARSANQGGA